MIRVVVHQFPIRVIGFQKRKPLCRSFLNVVAAVTKQGQNIPGFLHRFFQIFSLAIKGLGIGLLSDGHILQPQGIDNGTADKQRCQRKDRRDHQGPAQRFVLWHRSNGIVFCFLIVFVADIAQSNQQIFSGHMQIPSFAR